jgi:hypothetical protein
MLDLTQHGNQPPGQEMDAPIPRAGDKGLATGTLRTDSSLSQSHDRVKPGRVEVITMNIPQELKTPQLVVWRYEFKNGRWTKPPYDAKAPSRLASSTDQTTWATFEQAYEAYEKSLDLDGIGFVPSHNDFIVGIDLDHCIDDAGNIAPWAMEILILLNSYTEISPSGHGLRIFIKGKLPGKGRKKGNIEVYDKDRYLTVTGHHLPSAPLEINERQDQLDTFMKEYFPTDEKTSEDISTQGHSTLTDDEVIEKASTAKNGDNFKKLHAGDHSDHPSHSEADLSYCSLTAFWTNKDPEQMDRLYRNSGLYRNKWDEKHGEQTYGELTIRKAISLCKETYTPSLQEEPGNVPTKQKLVVIGCRAFIELDLPPRTNIMAPWLPSQGLVLIHAIRGVGKTHLAMLVAYTVACGGTTIIGWNAPTPKGVLFIDGEMPACVLQERLSGLVLGTGIEPPAPLNIITPDLQPMGMPDLSTREGQELIEPYIEDIDLIIVDNISTLVRSGRENEAEGWQPAQEWALRLRSKGKSVLFIHHSGKGGQQRGTSKREDVLDTVIGLKHPSDYSPDQGCRFEVHFEKARGLTGDDVKPVELMMVKDDKGIITWVSRTIDDSRHDKILELHSLGMSQSDIAKELNINRSTVCRQLKALKMEVE